MSAVHAAGVLTKAGFEIVRPVRRENGAFAFLVKPPVGEDGSLGEAAIEPARAALTAAGYTLSPHSPAWMPLRKMILVACEPPNT